MYVTWNELFQYDQVIIAIITLTVTFMVYINRKKK